MLKTQEEQTSTDPVIVAVTTDQRSCARRLGTHSLLVLDTMLVAAFLVLGTAFSIVLMVFT